MRLLYVDNTLALHGGIERVLTDKLNWLVEYGNCEVCLLTASQGNHPFVFSLSSKVKHYDLGIMFHQIFNYPLWKRYLRLFQLRRLFRLRMCDRIDDFLPDVIICTRLDLIGDVMKIRGTIPVVYEAHNSFLAYKYEHYSLLRRVQIKFWHKSLKNVDLIVALTQGDALEWKRITKNVEVIPNVVHLNNSDLYSNCSNKNAVFVGRFSYQKDMGTVVKIWRLVHKRHPDWMLHIFSDYGVLKGGILSACHKDGIILHSPTSDIIPEYIKCSILLLTSLYEPFGLVLPEAMSCGVPVVSFDCPYGPAEIISDGIDGYLIPNRSVNDYVDKVCFLIENDDLRRKMGQTGVISSQRYDANVVMCRWKKIFSELVS